MDQFFFLFDLCDGLTSQPVKELRELEEFDEGKGDWDLHGQMDVQDSLKFLNNWKDLSLKWVLIDVKQT